MKTKKPIVNENELIKIFDDTRVLSNTVFKEDTEKSKNDTKVYKEGELVSADYLPLSVSQTSVNFEKGGTLEIGTKYTNTYHTALLNFADGLKPGGFPELGYLTQEENLCRCTNLYEVLISDKCDRDYYGYNKINDNYGLCTDRVMYVPNVAIFKDDITYEPTDVTYSDIITCPAPCCLFDSDESACDVYRKRIEQIVLSAIENKVECLVLGAWGCGAFMQDPNLIAESFVDVLNLYGSFFEKIVFAIRSTPGYEKPNSSYSIFLNAFCKKYCGLVVEGE